MKPTTTNNKRSRKELPHNARTSHPHPYSSNYATNGAFQLETNRLESRTSYNSSISSTAYGSSFAAEGSFDWNTPYERYYGSNPTAATTTRALDHHSRNFWDNGAPSHSSWYCNSSPPPLPIPTIPKMSFHQHSYNTTRSSIGLPSLSTTWHPSMDTKVLPTTTCEVCCERKQNLQSRSVGTMTCGEIDDTFVDNFAKTMFHPPADDCIPTGPFVSDFPTSVDVETPRSLTMLFAFEDTSTMYCPETTQPPNDEWSVTSPLPNEREERNIALKITNDTSSEEEDEQDWESILTEISPEKRRLRPRRKCTIPDCGNRVVQGGLCISHGAKRKPCGFPNCPKFVKHAGMCSAHGPRRKRCLVGGCDKASVQRGMCIAHGAKKKLCLTEGCERQGVVKGMCKRHRVVEEGTKSV